MRFSDELPGCSTPHSHYGSIYVLIAKMAEKAGVDVDRITDRLIEIFIFWIFDIDQENKERHFERHF